MVVKVGMYTMTDAPLTTSWHTPPGGANPRPIWAVLRRYAVKARTWQPSAFTFCQFPVELFLLLVHSFYFPLSFLLFRGHVDYHSIS